MLMFARWQRDSRVDPVSPRARPRLAQSLSARTVRAGRWPQPSIRLMVVSGWLACAGLATAVEPVATADLTLDDAVTTAIRMHRLFNYTSPAPVIQ